MPYALPTRNPTVRVAATVALTFAAFAPHAARSELLDYKFTTIILETGQIGSAASFFSDKTVTGGFRYNNTPGATAVFPGPPAMGSTIYIGNFTNLSGQVSGQSFAATTGNVVISNDKLIPGPGLPGIDGIIMVASQAGFSGFSIPGFNLVGAQVSFFEGVFRGDFLQDQALPQTLNGLTVGRFTFVFVPVTGGPATPVNFVTSITPVPEPATWAMMILGFGIAGAASRRVRVRARQAAAPA